MSSLSDCPAIDITTESILNKIRELPLKCSRAPEGIPPIVYRRLALSLADPLCLIYRRSYEEGTVPHYFRLSVVTPVHKKNSKSEIDNYRPVAQESIACVIFEKIVVDHISHCLSSKGLLDDAQHGFTKGKSTSTQLVGMTQDWAMFRNNRQAFDCVYFDFSKAFDRVCHSRLLVKLHRLAIDNKTISWISSYLQDRKFRVKLNSTFSSPGDCPSGVPQGSCVGPLLFCIFILDLKQVIPTGVTHKLYADDLKLYARCDNVAGRVLLQSAIESVAKWCDDNGMVISLPKCATMSSKVNDSVYYLNGVPIPKCDSMRDLGVTVTTDLNFERHIADVVRSANAVCNTAFRCFIVRNPQLYVTLYNSLVVPKYLYCSEVWRPYLKRHTDALVRVQRRFIRRISIRCGVARNSIQLKPIDVLHDAADLRMYAKLCKLSLVDRFLQTRSNNLRSGLTICALEVARTERIDNMFSWRVARLLRQRD